MYGSGFAKMAWMADVDFTEREIDDLYVFLRAYHRLEPAGDGSPR